MEKSILSITFNCNYIATIVCSLDPNKSNGHDMISISMLKKCSKPIYKPLELIFQPCIKHGKILNEWKMVKVAPVNKKSDKQILKNYRSASLLPIVGKCFETFIYWTTYSRIDQVKFAEDCI